MDHVEASKEIRRAVDTGKVVFGTKESLHSLRHGEGQLLVVAQNTPVLSKEDLIHTAQLADIPAYMYAGNGLELGNTCGKPFVVTSMLILDAGKSRAEELGKAQTQTASESADKPKKGRKKKA